MHQLYAILLAAVAASFADWLFMGLLFHDRYQRFPEVWRDGNESRRIALAQLFAVVSATGFVLLAGRLNQTDWRGASKLAAMIWLVGPLPLLLANHLFIRLDPRITASHAAGWLAKLLLIAGATAWLT